MLQLGGANSEHCSHLSRASFIADPCFPAHAPWIFVHSPRNKSPMCQSSRIPGCRVPSPHPPVLCGLLTIVAFTQAPVTGPLVASDSCAGWGQSGKVFTWTSNYRQGASTYAINLLEAYCALKYCTVSLPQEYISMCTMLGAKVLPKE